MRSFNRSGGGAKAFLAIAAVLVLFSGCAKEGKPPAQQVELSLGTQAEASDWTRAANQKVLEVMDFTDDEDAADAQRGFIATLPKVLIKNPDGSTAWSLSDFDFEKEKNPPATANPILWRNARLNLNNGLFKVADRIYQVRGFDLTNLTIVEGDSAIIVIDPGAAASTAQAALDFYFQQRGKKPVVAVVITHSHVDHFAGIKSIISDEDAASGRVPVIAPEGFLEYAISENVLAGTAMSRRAQYQFGVYLPRSATGALDIGGGKALPVGSMAIIPPTREIKATGEKLVIDGVEMLFQIVSGTEAPASMTVYFPQVKALNSAELANSFAHNILTPRGAQVRDANLWSKCLNQMIELYGDRIDVVFGPHGWPRWGGEKIVTFLRQQRDLYKYTHDQALRLLNHGLTPDEIAATVKLPASLAGVWNARDAYGSLSFNVRAVYQKYLGFYDGNPASLDPLPPVESARKYVEYMGGPAAVIARARDDFAKGEYRWVVEALKHVVFADASNQEARNLAADAMEQLAYQAESSSWRNCYLVGASELRTGTSQSIGAGSVSPDMVRGMSLDMFFDFMGVRLNGPKAEGKRIVVNWNFTDTGEKYALNLENSALTYVSGKLSATADATVNLTRSTLNSVMAGETTFPKELLARKVGINGNLFKVLELMGLLDTFNPMFNIVTP